MTKYYQDQFVNIKQVGLVTVVSCGALPTPPNGRKSTFNFLSGAEVKFDCDPGYVLLGEQRRWCYASGDWNWPEDGEATCVSEAEYLTMQGGITAGTVLAVLLPVLIALLCYASYVRNKDRKDYQEPAFVRAGSRKINQFFRNSNRRYGSESRQVPLRDPGNGGGSSVGGKRTPDTQNSDDTPV
ncbi:hypothetical protein O3P69_006132 [Scylla paramamosain]|uniref:Sushi domain-containing protein n=2 Tax=Scylla paramamosain TaxID=85552 RepID=A0AAW0U582_SCYPA